LKNTAIVIAGPTASGKTALAIRIAQHFQTSILSADSRQCYRELNIGVAKPNPEELAAVPHYFINSHSIHEPVEAAMYEQYGLESLAEIFQRQPVAVVTGGTGLYIKALCEGVDQMPAINEETRLQTRQQYHENGLEWLQEEVRRADPIYYETGEVQNPHRLMRALEFFRTTGQSIRHFQKGVKRERPFHVIKLAIHLPKEELHERINQRVDNMMTQGLEAEVRSLVAFKDLKALQTVGYREIFDHLAGLSSMDAAIEFIKRNTRQYAKRQMTWFKKDPSITWFHPEDVDGMLSFISKNLPT
jgi:tRNA dimethylallyltransferase